MTNSSFTDNNENPTTFKNKVSMCLTSHKECPGEYVSADGKHILKCKCSCDHNGKTMSDSKRPHNLVGAQEDDTVGSRPLESSNDTSDDSDTSVVAAIAALLPQIVHE
jgi:hypothetical protein